MVGVGSTGASGVRLVYVQGRWPLLHDTSKNSSQIAQRRIATLLHYQFSSPQLSLWRVVTDISDHLPEVKIHIAGD